MRTRFRPIDQYLSDQTPARIVTLSVLALIAITVLDRITGPEIAFSFFYLIPILTGTWYVGRKTGMALSAISTFLWLWADRASGHSYSHAAIPLWNSGVRFMFFVLSSYMLSFIKVQLETEAEMADTDPLTGLQNRRAFYERCSVELERSRRYHQPLSLAYFDLDNFKWVNDTMGHETGDELLRTVSETMQWHIRKTDTAARLGGDEFAMLFSMADFETSGEALRKVHRLLDELMKERGWPVTFSIGMITVRDHDRNVGDMLNAADRLMYEVKKKGKNAVVHTVWPEGNTG